jgi:trimethylamine:corrinoid methyltransferase-like protein
MKPFARLSSLSDAEIQAIHNAMLSILEQTGTPATCGSRSKTI